jgi:hypothetical protein
MGKPISSIRLSCWLWFRERIWIRWLWTRIWILVIPPPSEDLRIVKMLTLPLFVELRVPWLNKTHKKDRFISVFWCGLKLHIGLCFPLIHFVDFWIFPLKLLFYRTYSHYCFVRSILLFFFNP